jgi:hypothetical protein
VIISTYTPSRYNLHCLVAPLHVATYPIEHCLSSVEGHCTRPRL